MLMFMISIWPGTLVISVSQKLFVILLIQKIELIKVSIAVSGRYENYGECFFVIWLDLNSFTVLDQNPT